jgi:hypothetical protein
VLRRSSANARREYNGDSAAQESRSQSFADGYDGHSKYRLRLRRKRVAWGDDLRMHYFGLFAL